MRISKLSLFLFILIITDVVYTFLQCYYSMNLDGDMCAIIMASKDYRKILTDPFGLSVLFNNEYYAATNRFFVHWFMRLYFRSVPFLFQSISDPINSVFISMAFARTLIQLLIVYLLSKMISNSGRIFNLRFLIAAIIIIPFFQITGFAGQMAVTDNSITYTFFYGLPFVFLLFYFQSFFKYFFHKEELSITWIQHLFLLILSLMIALGGPLGPAVIIIVCPSLLIYLICKNFRKETGIQTGKGILNAIKKIPATVLFHFIFITFFCFYSAYLGSHNSENLWFTMPIINRYKLLPEGFWSLFSVKMGLPLLFVLCVINIILVKRFKNVKSKEIVVLSYSIGIFCVVYLLLLPLGGYRAYRPLIIRSDTFSPLTLAMIFIYGLNSIYLLNYFKDKSSKIFIALLVLVISIFSNADRINLQGNSCERESLKIISSSPDQIVLLNKSCSPLSWNKIIDYHDSEVLCDLLLFWDITGEKKFYYQER